MKNIAQQTGGEAFVNTNDLKRVIARSLEDGSTYYTLAYTPPKEDEGGYHKVVVQVPNKNWKLAYRRGYYSIPPATASGAVGTAALRTALQPGMPPATSMLLTASLELPDATRKEVKINYIINSNGVEFTDAPDNKKRAQIDCMVIAFDSSGKEVAHASDTLDATLPANAYAAVMAHGIPAHQLICSAAGQVQPAHRRDGPHHAADRHGGRSAGSAGECCSAAVIGPRCNSAIEVPLPHPYFRKILIWLGLGDSVRAKSS